METGGAEGVGGGEGGEVGREEGVRRCDGGNQEDEKEKREAGLGACCYCCCCSSSCCWVGHSRGACVCGGRERMGMDTGEILT